MLTGRPLAKIDAVAQAVRDAGGEAIALEAVAGNASDAKTTVQMATDAWRRVDVLDNNAHSITDYLPLEDPKMTDHLRIDLGSSLIGSLQLMQNCFPICARDWRFGTRTKSP